MPDQHLGLDSFARPPGLRFSGWNAAAPTAAGVPFDAPFDTVSFNPDGLAFTGGAVTVPEGSWLVEAHITLQGTSNNRTNYDASITVDGTPDPGSLGMMYLRLTNYGASAALSAVVVVPPAGSVAVGAQVERTNGSSGGLFIAGGSRLLVHRLSS